MKLKMDFELTPRQKEILDLIQDCIETRGYGPTVREIAEQFGIASPNGVMCHLKALEAKGYISRAARKSRGIELTAEFLDSTKGLPLLGVVKAGGMTEAIEQTERIDFTPLLEQQDAFVVQVSGDSMIDAHICEGDFVIVRPAKNAQAGDIVVVQNDEGEATLKYWFPEKNRVRLQPANRKMKPIYLRKPNLTGVVVGVIRQLK